MVTILFSDVTGFTTISERLDPEALRAVMEEYFTAMRDVIERHGGRVEKFIGDAVMAVFGLPVVREDDAVRAIRAAVEISAALEAVNTRIPRGLGIELTASTGVNTGEVFVSHDPGGTQVGEVLGDAVNVAARLEAAADPREVLLGELTYKLTRGAIEAERSELTLKGKSQPVTAFRLQGLAAANSDADRTLSARTVGRDDEAAQIADALMLAGERGSCVLLTLTGVAGSGKSRLARDTVATLAGRARALTGRCLPYGEAAIFWPLAEIACQAAGISQEEDPEVAVAELARLLAPEPTEGDWAAAARLAGALGLGPLAGAPEETRTDVARLLASLAAPAPLVAVIEDIHWASPTLLSTIEYVAAHLLDARLLIICTARPELLEARPDWSAAVEGARLIALDTLDETQSIALVTELLGAGAAADILAVRVAEVAGGNPLVVEEVLAMLADDGLLVRVGEVWELRGSVGEIRIPPTIEAILAARLDRLAPAERDAIEAAAIVGKDFDLREVRALSDTEARVLEGAVAALAHKQLITAAPDGLTDYTFHHILVRDAAYAAMPKRRRSSLHERFADHLGESPSGRGRGVYGEIVGEHLERACVLRRELGQEGPEIDDLARRAAALLAEAASRAIGLSDTPAARRIYLRAEEVLARDDPLRAVVLAALAEATLDYGLITEAQRAARTALRLAREFSLEPVRLRASLVGARADVYCGERELNDGLAELRELVSAIEQTGDDNLIVWANMARADMAGVGGYFTESWTAAARAVTRARELKLGSLPYCLVGLCATLPRSAVPLAQAFERCEEALSLVQADTLHAAVIEARGLGVLHGLAGDLASARRYFDRSIAVCQRYGAHTFHHLCLMDWGSAELYGGDFERAELIFRRSIEVCAALDELVLGEARTLHSLALARVGEHERALCQALEASQIVTPSNLEPQVWWRIAAALALAGLERHEEAESCARDAHALALSVDAPLLLGDALLTLGEVLLGRGRSRDGSAALESAVEVYEAKGATAGARVAQSSLSGAGEPRAAR